MKNGQALWKKAKSIIPGGNMLLSKRSEMHLPDYWPSYFSKSSGCSIWDLEGNHYHDYYLMGVGTNILGYSNPEVDKAVINTVRQGNMSTLNAPEEVYLAQKLLEIDSWADQVRFARTGGEANAIAIRIARAASGRDGVAICGYHGWHDWYISANLNENDQLAGHLLPGLKTSGVPKALKGETHPFNYNDLETLNKLIKDQDIGVIKMEVMRNYEPKDDFLQHVRRIATENNIVLIFDECTSAFRETLGGLHKIYGVNPDMAVYGKTLGNGYAISAIVGTLSVMEAAQSTFISSTFWTERIGSVAALKTLSVMEETRPWEHAKKIGSKMRSLWAELASKHNLDIEINGLPAISSYKFNSEQGLAYKTFLTQEFLKKGFLGGTAFYACSEHSISQLDNYYEILDKIFEELARCEDGQDIYKILDGPVCHSGFMRLN